MSQFYNSMLNQQFRDISITFHVLGFTSPLIRTHPQTIYNLSIESKEKVLFGVNHKGNTSNWNDAFAIKLSLFKQNEIFFTILVNNIELGKAKLELLQIYQSIHHQNRNEFLMTKNGKNTGYIDIKIVKSSSIEVIGGLPIPKLSFRSDHIQNARNSVFSVNRLSLQKQIELPSSNSETKRPILLGCLDDNTNKNDQFPQLRRY